MSEISLLIVDDDESIQVTFQDSYEIANNLSYTLRIHKALTEEDANKLIDSLEIDLAIIDLKLNSTETENLGGNQVIDQIISKLRVPIIIHSATPSALSEVNAKKVIKKFNKDCDKIEILNEIEKLHNTGIFSILGRRGKIEELINKIYWDSFSTNLNEWQNCEHQLLRHFAAHLHKELEYIDAREDNFLPNEFYVSSVSQDHNMTGNIYQKDEVYYVTITPACDFAQNSVRKPIEGVTLLKIDTDKIAQLATEIKSETSTNKKQSLESKLKNLITNNSAKYYFFPKNLLFKEGVVNFQKITTITYSDLENYKNVLSVSPVFTKDLISKFSAYFARQGSPDISATALA